MDNLKTDIFDIIEDIEENVEYTTYSFKYITQTVQNDILKKEENISNKVKKTVKQKVTVITVFVGLIKYIATSTLIFAVLLLTANYSAYIDVAKSYIYADQLKIESNSLLNSVEASQITSKLKEKTQINKKVSEEMEKSKKSKYSIKKLVNEVSKKKPKLDIEITPYENRIIIPKIAKNIPLVDIKQRSVKWEKELENIFMKELEDWVVRYPWSTKPWSNWNTFIFGHSSNYPWIKWDYNDVFANLNNLVYEDEIIVYYDQKKYTYKIREKKVVSPGQTNVIKRNNDNKDEITLMTCWPLWTTLNRLIIVWERIDNK